MRLEWIQDSAFRFFPPLRDDLFGYVLHPVDLGVLATEQPIDVPGLHRRILRMIEDAERFINRIPTGGVGVVFLDDGKAVQPDPGALGKYERRAGSMGGVWPSSAEISSAMLERYQKLSGDEPGD